MKTYAPSLANSFAVANPIPSVPPVMTAVLPSSFLVMPFSVIVELELLLEFEHRLPNACLATSEYSRRYLHRTSCKDHAIRSRYAALPVRCPASGRGDTEAAAQCRKRRSPRRRFACSSTR